MGRRPAYRVGHGDSRVTRRPTGATLAGMLTILEAALGALLAALRPRASLVAENLLLRTRLRPSPRPSPRLRQPRLSARHHRAALPRRPSAAAGRGRRARPAAGDQAAAAVPRRAARDGLVLAGLGYASLVAAALPRYAAPAAARGR